MTFAIPLVLIGLAAVCDLRTREVPDWVSLALLAWAVVAAAVGWGDWYGLLYGLLLGSAVGAMLFYLGRFGGADAKLIAALGAAIGPAGLLTVLFWMALAGAALAIVSAVRGRRDFAYVPAIAAGLAIYAIWPQGLRDVLLQ